MLKLQTTAKKWCDKDSFIKNDDDCDANLILLTGDDTKKCDKDSFIKNNDKCNGKWIKLGIKKCTKDSFILNNEDCLGKFQKLQKTTKKKCDKDSFIRNADECVGKIIELGVSLFITFILVLDIYVSNRYPRKKLDLQLVVYWLSGSKSNFF